jgi:hypothetical protein
MAEGRLRLVADDLPTAHRILVETAPAALKAGSVRIAVWSFVWLARAGWAVGSWWAAPCFPDSFYGVDYAAICRLRYSS